MTIFFILRKRPGSFFLSLDVWQSILDWIQDSESTQLKLLQTAYYQRMHLQNITIMWILPTLLEGFHYNISIIDYSGIAGVKKANILAINTIGEGNQDQVQSYSKEETKFY